MPALFIGHGSPMNTLATNRYTTAWAEMAASLPTPRAIVAISAHWFINATAVTSMAVPRVIHDFYGFPQELFDFDYPAPGSPDLARQVAAIAQPEIVHLDDETWGIDHGTWSVLAKMYPAADVPVLQLSLKRGLDPADHLAAGRALAPLRDEGVLAGSSTGILLSAALRYCRAQTGGALRPPERVGGEEDQILEPVRHRPRRHRCRP